MKVEEVVPLFRFISLLKNRVVLVAACLFVNSAVTFAGGDEVCVTCERRLNNASSTPISTVTNSTSASIQEVAQKIQQSQAVPVDPSASVFETYNPNRTLSFNSDMEAFLRSPGVDPNFLTTNFWATQPFMSSPMYPPMYPSLYPTMHSSMDPFMYPLMHSSMYSPGFAPSFTPSFVPNFGFPNFFEPIRWSYGGSPAGFLK